MAARLARIGLVMALLSAAGYGRAEPADTAASNERSAAAKPAERAPTMTSIEFVGGGDCGGHCAVGGAGRAGDWQAVWVDAEYRLRNVP